MFDILSQDVMYAPGVGPKRKELLEKELSIKTYGDLLEHFPYKYVDRSRIYEINEVSADMPFVQLKGKILSFELFDMGIRKKRLVAHFSDGSGVLDLIWFSGVKFIMKNYKPNTEYIVFGKPTIFNQRYQIAHPEIEDEKSLNLSSMGMQPYYNTTEKMKNAGVTSRTLEKIIKNLIQKLPNEIPETLPHHIKEKQKLVSKDYAMRKIHYPSNVNEMQKARYRLKFEELFFLQLNILRYAKYRSTRYKGICFPISGAFLNDFYSHCLPFPLTEAQKRVVREIRKDMGSGLQMNRLLQGDVGSGKTLVALMSMLIAIGNGYQACIMAPTEILAEQHLTTITTFVKSLNIRVELLTGSVKGKNRERIMNSLVTGQTNILIGTHAIIEDNVAFYKLGLAVIDEQHRFGVAQRAKLWSKNNNPPHILVMTATPIPRTLAMTIYGDLDVSIIDELPPGRKPISTIHRYERNKTALYKGIREEISIGRQVYIVYPLIKESEKIDLQNLEEGYKTITEAFPNLCVSKIHGKMKPKEKDAEMQKFVCGETSILIATTVIEVGVNVPNATVMIINDAQRFGLSQLHQLRGRVGRGGEQSYCILVTKQELSKETKKRIDIMCQTNDGFKIAEADLKLRGPGDIEGTQQSGIAFDLKISNITQDSQLIVIAREQAEQVIKEDLKQENHIYDNMWNHLYKLRKSNVYWGAIS